jgi:hypothetical protein
MVHRTCIEHRGDIAGGGTVVVVGARRRDANTDLPDLISFALRLTSEVGVLVSGIPLRESGEPEDWDNLCFMAACFVSRQVDHLRGVLTLVDKGLDSEALVLARSMLEGMIQLLWAAQDPDERPLRWRAFSLIEDWLLAQRADPASTTVEETEWRALDARVRSEGVPFLTRRAKNAIASGDAPPPDPYHDNWFGGGKIRDMFDQTSGADLWSLYGRASENVHWTPRGLGSSLVRREGSIVYSAVDRARRRRHWPGVSSQFCRVRRSLAGAFPPKKQAWPRSFGSTISR